MTAVRHPDHFKRHRMCNKAVEDEPETLEYAPNYFKAQELCERAIENEPYSLKFVPEGSALFAVCP